MGAVIKIAAKTPEYKIIARLEKKTEIKPVENTSAFASKADAITASLLPNYTPVFSWNFIAVRSYPVLPGLGRHSRKETRVLRVDILCLKSSHELMCVLSFPNSILVRLDNKCFIRPSSDIVLLPCRTQLQLGSTVARLKHDFDSDVVP